jgi:hypothetical protein
MVAHVQSKSGVNTTGNNIVVTFDNPTTAGNLVVVSFGWRSTENFTSFVDSLTNTWSQVGTEINNFDLTYSRMYACLLTNAGSSHSLTLTVTGSTNKILFASEFSGIQSTPIDKTAGTSGSGTSMSSGVTASRAQADELLVAYFTAQHSSAPNPNYTAGANFSILTNTLQTDYTKLLTGFHEYQVVSSIGTDAATSTSDVSSAWTSRIGTFKASAPAPTLDQEGFRWRNDDGSETTATWKDSQDTNITAPAGQNMRLRMIVNATLDPAAKDFQLEGKLSTDSNWVKI